MTSFEKTISICKILSDAKARNVVYIDIKKRDSVCDYYVVCSALSSTALHALFDKVEEQMKKKYDVHPLSSDGVKDGQWYVHDYGDVIVHVFNEQARDFYRLEHLWEDNNNVIPYVDKKD